MASYQVIPAPTAGLSQGLGKGFDTASDMFSKYVATMLESKMKKKYEKENEAEKFSEIERLRKDPRFSGMEQEFSYDGSPKISFKTPKAKDINPDEAFKRVMAGYGTPEEQQVIGQRAGVVQQQPQIIEPGMSMVDGTERETQYSQPEPYADTLRKALLPQYSQKEVAAEAAGMPKPKQGIDENFKADFIATVNAAGDDNGKFVEGLKRLAMKYPDNPEVLKLINEQLQISTKKNPAEEDSFGGADWK